MCAIIFLSRGYDLLTRSNDIVFDLLSRYYEIKFVSNISPLYIIVLTRLFFQSLKVRRNIIILY